mgnify:CR=1 FL=1
MKLKSRAEWDEFLTRNYSKLLFTARKWTAEPRDLVHHTYLRCIDKRFPSDEDENPLGYFIKAMYNEATRGRKPSNENKCSLSSTASVGSIEQSSDYICKGGTWLTYLDGLGLESQFYIDQYTNQKKS